MSLLPRLMIDQAMTFAMLLIPVKLTRNLVGILKRPSRVVLKKQWTGIWTILSGVKMYRMIVTRGSDWVIELLSIQR